MQQMFLSYPFLVIFSDLGNSETDKHLNFLVLTWNKSHSGCPDASGWHQTYWCLWVLIKVKFHLLSSLLLINRIGQLWCIACQQNMKLCWPYVKYGAWVEYNGCFRWKQCVLQCKFWSVKFTELTFSTCSDGCAVLSHVGSKLSYLTESWCSLWGRNFHVFKFHTDSSVTVQSCEYSQSTLQQSK